MPEVLFVSDRFVELEIVLRSVTIEKVDGYPVRNAGERIQFVKTRYRGAFRGEYNTGNEKYIRIIRNHDMYKSGTIFEAEVPEDKDRVSPELVRQGMRSSNEKLPLKEPAPPETTEPAKKAKVGRGLGKRKRTPVAA